MISNNQSMFQGERRFDRNEGSNEILSVCLHFGRIPDYLTFFFLG